MLISVAAGIRAADIQRWSGCAAVVRGMPNRPALVGCGVTGLFATAAVSADRRAIAEGILRAVGKTLWLDREADMDAVTAISGSGPAYFFLLIEMLEESGVALGLTREVSRKLAVETAFGAGSMARAADAIRSGAARPGDFRRRDDRSRAQPSGSARRARNSFRKRSPRPPAARLNSRMRSAHPDPVRSLTGIRLVDYRMFPGPAFQPVQAQSSRPVRDPLIYRHPRTIAASMNLAFRASATFECQGRQVNQSFPRPCAPQTVRCRGNQDPGKL